MWFARLGFWVGVCVDCVLTGCSEGEVLLRVCSCGILMAAVMGSGLFLGLVDMVTGFCCGWGCVL